MTFNPLLRIMIADEKGATPSSIVTLLETAGWDVEAFADVDCLVMALGTYDADIILTNIDMPFCDQIKKVSAENDIPLVLISPYAGPALEAIPVKDSINYVVQEACDPAELLSLLRNVSLRNRMKREITRHRQKALPVVGLGEVLIGETPAIQNLRQEILSLALAPAAVLILGETGTGKDVVARALHEAGPLATRPFIAVNCALLSPKRFVADMFGIANGPPGKIVRADGGTLFLDEICACPQAVQARLLRVLEEGVITPEGSVAHIPVNIRIISATNEDIESAVADGRFREDLYFRLNTFTLELPPLRKRRDDLKLLLKHFLKKMAPHYEVQPPDLTAEDMLAVLAHEWPGNVRELCNVAQRRLLAARCDHGTMASAINPALSQNALPGNLRKAVAILEREMIKQAIKANGGRMDEVAASLGIGRRTLNDKIVKLGVDKDSLKMS